jgi:hypothetical protein
MPLLQHSCFRMAVLPGRCFGLSTLPHTACAVLPSGRLWVEVHALPCSGCCCAACGCFLPPDAVCCGRASECLPPSIAVHSSKVAACSSVRACLSGVFGGKTVGRWVDVVMLAVTGAVLLGANDP